MADAPLINGSYYSFANIEFRANGSFIQGIKSINYGHKIGSAWVRGTNQMPLGATQGQYEPRCEIEIYRPQLNYLLTILSAIPPFNYFAAASDITVTYGNLLDNGSLPTFTDLIVGAKIIDIDLANTEGIDPTAGKLTLMPIGGIVLAGLEAIVNRLPTIGAVG